MKDISRVEQSERVNYDIAEGMINYIINRLKETSESFNKKFEEDFKKSLEDLTLHLIEEELVKKYEVKVEDSDIQDMAKSMARLQMMQYGAMNLPDDMLENFAQRMLQDEKTANMLITRAINEKLTAAMKEVVTLNEKKVSSEEFQDLLK